MGILECQWGYQFLDVVFDETHETQWGYGTLDGVLGLQWGWSKANGVV